SGDNLPPLRKTHPGLHLSALALGLAIAELGTDGRPALAEGGNYRIAESPSPSDRVTLPAIGCDGCGAIQILGNAKTYREFGIPEIVVKQIQLILHQRPLILCKYLPHSFHDGRMINNQICIHGLAVSNARLKAASEVTCPPIPPWAASMSKVACL